MKTFLPKLICLFVAIIGFEIGASLLSSAYAGGALSTPQTYGPEGTSEEARRMRARRAAAIERANRDRLMLPGFRGHGAAVNIDFGALIQDIRGFFQSPAPRQRRVARPPATPALPAAEPLNPTQYQVLSESDIREDQRGDTECGICLMELIQQLPLGVVRLNCNTRGAPGHMFCKPCIETAYRSKQECPVCRGHLNPNP